MLMIVIALSMSALMAATTLSALHKETAPVFADEKRR